MSNAWEKLNTRLEMFDQFGEYDKSRISTTCRRELKTKNGKAQICLFSDQHIGSKFCDFEAVKETIHKCVKDDIYVLLGGDLIEGSTRNSVGAGVYDQLLNPTEQLFALLELLNPLIEKDLIVSIIGGNHEARFRKDVGLDVLSIISWMHKIPYLGTGGFNYLTVDDQKYIVYYEHGSGGSKLLPTRMKRVMDASKNIEKFDIFAWGHLHDMAVWSGVTRNYNTRNKNIENINKVYALTGHYLKYDKSYAHEASLPPSGIGSPYFTLDGKERMIEYYSVF